MSFDLSELPTKTEFADANPPLAPVTPPSAQEMYDLRKSRIQTRILDFFGRTEGLGTELNIHIEFLTADDKAALITALESKGFSCSETKADCQNVSFLINCSKNS